MWKGRGRQGREREDQRVCCALSGYVERGRGATGLTFFLAIGVNTTAQCRPCWPEDASWNFVILGISFTIQPNLCEFRGAVYACTCILVCLYRWQYLETSPVSSPRKSVVLFHPWDYTKVTERIGWVGESLFPQGFLTAVGKAKCRVWPSAVGAAMRKRRQVGLYLWICLRPASTHLLRALARFKSWLSKPQEWPLLLSFCVEVSFNPLGTTDFGYIN